ncbi:hypothetical protein [Streptomyces pactum]|uniref:Secreted protein n=1 Tax=Streptomyces pactum TaxID=68249 RepID=A0A1S6J465_9ACTN|nr:hypothetical protein [Streptomyces pactum]AQS66549.1 hypothetical protein B1H29_06075 [Streptomyces pactum]
MRIRSAIFSLGIAAACTGLTATTAAAYNDSDLDWETWARWTSDCRNGEYNDPCAVRTPGELDGTFFKHDSGGKGIKLVMYKGSKTIAQVEFHPYDEVLHVYDGVNDGDTVYVRLRWNDDYSPGDDATYWAPGTSASVDHHSIQLDGDDDIDEGNTVQLRVYDDKALNDPITDWYYLKA